MSDPTDVTNKAWDPRLGPFRWERNRVLYRYERHDEPNTYEIAVSGNPAAWVESRLALDLTAMR